MQKCNENEEINNLLIFPSAHHIKEKEESTAILRPPTLTSLQKLKQKLGEISCGAKYLSFISDAELVIDQKCYLMIIEGDHGAGKTTILRTVLNDKGKVQNLDYIIVSGNITPRALYELLYDYKDKNKIICFDDCLSILKNPISAELVKAAADNKSTRTVTYRTTTDSSIPQSFQFEASVIIFTNTPLDNSNAPLKDRGFFKRLRLKPFEKLEYIKTFLLDKSLMHESLENVTDKEIQHVLTRLEEVVSIGATNFTCRTFEQLLTRYHYAPETLEEALFDLIDTDSKEAILLSVMKEHTGKPKIWKQKFLETGKFKDRSYEYALQNLKENLPNNQFQFYMGRNNN